MLTNKIYSIWAVLIILIGGCGEGILQPGDIARPLVGNYKLESRQFLIQDSAGTELEFLTPPRVESFLRLNFNGRYGQVDSITLDDSTGTQVFVENGRWSVLNNRMFLETDTNLLRNEEFRYDGIRLTRIEQDNVSNANGVLNVIDIWRKDSRFRIKK